MAFQSSIALTFAMGAIGLLRANNPVAFHVNEPVRVAGVPAVTLGPGLYVLRTVGRSGGASVVQVLSSRRDYVYTTVLAIPAERPYADDSRQILLTESPSGIPPALHFWFPPGETRGQEFVATPAFSIAERPVASMHLKSRMEGSTHGTVPSEATAADLYELHDVLARIDNGKFGAARDAFRRNYYLTQNREGASIAFLLALLMTDRDQARISLQLVNRLDPERMRTLSRLDVYGVIESLPGARSNLKTSGVRRFLLNFALERPDDGLARSATVSFERHVAKVDSLPVEMALDRRREEREKERRQEEQWTLAKEQIARLSDCVKSLLNKVGALEYSAGSVRLTVVLTQGRLSALDAIAVRSHRTICDRHSRLERLIAQRNTAIARELDALRSALRELDRSAGSITITQFGSLRNWRSAPVSGVSHDLMILSDTAALPYMRPSIVLRTNGGYVSLGIAASLARLAEWAGL